MVAPSICIIDYGLGNVGSVGNALRVLDVDYMVTLDPAALEQAAGLILPGVGAFGDGMARLRQLGLVEVLGELVLRRKKPILGICLGMQLMAKTGLEHGCHQGLGWLDATVQRLDVESLGLSLPHVGWNELSIAREGVLVGSEQQGSDYYFVHSYHMVLNFPEDLVASCAYGQSFTAIVEHENIFGTQFHPEKSQKNGLRLLRQFVGFAAKTATLGLESRLP